MRRRTILLVILLSLFSALVTMRVLNKTDASSAQAAWAGNSGQRPISSSTVELQDVIEKEVTSSRPHGD